jgi:ankyrin repeat protein
MDIKLFTCPISYKIFNEPVLASDGHFYEKMMIEKWFETSNKSPVTGMIISNSLVVSYGFNELLSNFLLANPSELNNRFSINKIIPEKYKNIYSEENYKKYCHDDKIYARMINFNIFKNKEFINSEFIKKIIDCVDDLYFYDKKNQRSIFSYILSNSNFENIKYLLNKNIVNLEFIEPDDYGYKPIHYICQFGNIESFNYIIKKNVDVYSKTKYDDNIFNIVCYNKLSLDLKNYVYKYLKKNTDFFDVRTNNLKNIYNVITHCDCLIVEEMLRKIKSINIDLFYEVGYQILMCVCSNPDIILKKSMKKILNLLLDRIDINLSDNLNRKLYQIAIIHKNFYVAKFLINNKNFDKKTMEETDENKFPYGFDKNMLLSFLVNYIV